MATRIECAQCRRDLRPHCQPEGRCGWWVCTNRSCDARLFDLSRNHLIHTDGRLERLDPPTT